MGRWRALSFLFQPARPFRSWTSLQMCSSKCQTNSETFREVEDSMCPKNMTLLSSNLFWHFGQYSASEISLPLHSFVARGFWMPAKKALFPGTSCLGYGLFCKMEHTTWLILMRSLSSELEKVLLNKVCSVLVTSVSVFLGRPSWSQKQYWLSSPPSCLAGAREVRMNTYRVFEQERTWRCSLSCKNKSFPCSKLSGYLFLMCFKFIYNVKF